MIRGEHIRSGTSSGHNSHRFSFLLVLFPFTVNMLMRGINGPKLIPIQMHTIASLLFLLFLLLGFDQGKI